MYLCFILEDTVTVISSKSSMEANKPKPDKNFRRLCYFDK